MAVDDLWFGSDGQPTTRHGRGKRWRVRIPGHPSRAFDTKSEARWWEQELIRKGRRHDQGVTVAELVRQHLEGKQHLTPDSVGALRAGAAQVMVRWAGIRVGAVTRHEVQAWIAGLESQHGPRLPNGSRALRPAAAATRAKALQVLAGAMRIALEAELIDADPCVGVRVGRHRSIDPRFLDVDQLRTLAAAAEGSGTMVWLLGTTGLRLSECLRLDVADVDRGRRRLRVRMAKSGRGRDVPLPEFVLGMLDLDRPGPLFLSSRGGRIDGDNWRARVFKPAVAAAGLGELRIHDLRHTAASLMIASGADVKAVQNALGHASAKMTLDLYGHLWDRGLDDVAKRMDAMIQR